MKVIKVLLFLFITSACTTKQPSAETKVQKPKNIILLIGDGMGLTQIQAAMTVNNNHLNFERFHTVGLSKTSSASDYITDSAAGATAFSTGKKTYNWAIGVNVDTVAEKTILEYAEDAGMATGLVATSSVTHATPAAFIAHQPSRHMQEEIASDFLKTDIDVFIGGGKKYFTDRKDGANLADSLTSKGYKVFFDTTGMGEVHSGKLVALLAPDGMPPYARGRGEMLVPSAKKAIEILSQNEAGFFLMIEGSQIDWGGHDNNVRYMASELLDFDKTIGEVLDFAEKDGNTLVVVTADHETGGLTILDKDIMNDSTATNFSTDHHTPVMVPVFAKGPGEKAFGGIYENNTIFSKMMDALGLTIKNE